jgi:hypothetical protein
VWVDALGGRRARHAAELTLGLAAACEPTQGRNLNEVAVLGGIQPRNFNKVATSGGLPAAGPPRGRRRGGIRFNILVAVRMNADVVREAVGPAVYEAAEKLLSLGRLGEVIAVNGGARGAIDGDGGPPLDVWVGVVSGALAAECDCGAEGDDPCVHAVAVTLAAIRDGLDWASSATPPSGAFATPTARELTEVAAGLPPARLAALVGGYAATDERLATRLLTAAGRLRPLSEKDAAALRRSIDSVAGEATVGEFDLHDVVKAGEWIVAELEVLAERPPALAALYTVEHAAEVWDGLAGYLYDAWETYENEPEEIGGALRAVHVRMCEQLRPDPDELAERLREIIAAAESTSCLDAPEEYADLLDPVD